jgi:hypothetical protein
MTNIRNPFGGYFFPSYVDPGWTLTRAQADEPRFGNFGLLIEGQRINSATNPRLVGAMVGA